MDEVNEMILFIRFLDEGMNPIEADVITESKLDLQTKRGARLYLILLLYYLTSDYRSIVDRSYILPVEDGIKRSSVFLAEILMDEVSLNFDNDKYICFWLKYEIAKDAIDALCDEII